MNDVFLITGLASFLLRPLSVDLAIVRSVGKGTPANECAHASSFTSFLTAAFKFFASAKCCKYNATWIASAGKAVK